MDIDMILHRRAYPVGYISIRSLVVALCLRNYVNNINHRKEAMAALGQRSVNDQIVHSDCIAVTTSEI